MKMAPLVRAFAARADLPPVVLVHTGQHYDVAMNERLFADLELPAPDINLEVGSATHAVQTAEIMRRFEPVLDDLAPSCVVVVGDVNSTLACSLVAAKKRTPVVHVEAGLRSFDREMPEEINRVLTDQIADLLLHDRARGRRQSRARGHRARAHPLRRQRDDRLAACAIARARWRRRTRSRGPAARRIVGADGRFGVVTLHRPSNVDEREPLRESLSILRDMSRAPAAGLARPSADARQHRPLRPRAAARRGAHRAAAAAGLSRDAGAAREARRSC